MPESGEVAELIFTEISNGLGEERLGRVDGKDGGGECSVVKMVS